MINLAVNSAFITLAIYQPQASGRFDAGKQDPGERGGTGANDPKQHTLWDPEGKKRINARPVPNLMCIRCRVPRTGTVLRIKRSTTLIDLLLRARSVRQGFPALGKIGGPRPLVGSLFDLLFLVFVLLDKVRDRGLPGIDLKSNVSNKKSALRYATSWIRFHLALASTWSVFAILAAPCLLLAAQRFSPAPSPLFACTTKIDHEHETW
jgi:hypothetical protein